MKQLLTREDIEDTQAGEIYDAINKLVKNLLKDTNDPGMIAYTLFYIALDMSHQTCDDHSTVMANFLGAQLAYYHPKAEEFEAQKEDDNQIKLLNNTKTKDTVH